MSVISKVQIYEGSNLIGTAALNVSHPSVDVVYPGYPRANSGFIYTLDTTKLVAGLHNLKVQATGENGQVQSSTIQVRVDNAPEMCIDTPKNGNAIKGLTPISGWALNISGISNVQIYEGSNLLGTAALNVSHPSVDVVYPGYPRANSGFSYTLDTTKLVTGLHNLKVQATGKNGQVQSSTIQVRIDNAPKMCVDTPTNGNTIKGLTPISGWALNISGISKVQIYEGSNLLGMATLNVSHPSVDVVFPGYPRNNSGYSYTLDTTRLPNGTHTLAVIATGVDGITTRSSFNVTTNNQPMRMCVDTPKYGSTIRGLAPISGWALNMSVISKVQIYEGSTLLGTAALNVSHPSVDVVHPGYPRANSGFSYALDTTKLVAGLHNLKVQATGENGQVQSSTIQVKVDNAPKMCVDTPNNGTTIKGLTPISGWALNMTGISKVQIYEGSSLLGTAALSVSHPSVNVVLPGYPRNNTGYSYTLDTEKLTNGPKNLAVVATGLDGKTTTWNLTLKVNNQGAVSGALVKFLTGYEGFSAVPYRGVDIQNLTIGYGHVILPGESFTEITQNEGLSLFKSDLIGYEESTNDEFGNTLNQNEFDALVSFCFNTGKYVWSLANLTNDVKIGASAERLKVDFTNWCHVNGEVIQGLVNRRLDEWEMFVYGDYVRTH